MLHQKVVDNSGLQGARFLRIAGIHVQISSSETFVSALVVPVVSLQSGDGEWHAAFLAVQLFCAVSDDHCSVGWHSASARNEYKITAMLKNVVCFGVIVVS